MGKLFTSVQITFWFLMNRNVGLYFSFNMPSFLVTKEVSRSGHKQNNVIQEAHSGKRVFKIAHDKSGSEYSNCLCYMQSCQRFYVRSIYMY